MPDTASLDTSEPEDVSTDTAEPEDALEPVDVAQDSADPLDSDLSPEDTGPDLPPPVGPACPQVTLSTPPAELELPAFYTRYADVWGVPIVGSEQVPVKAFEVAYYVVANMLADRPCVREALIRANVRVGIMGVTELTTDMPEHADLNERYPNVDWNQRARGLGATLERPLASISEENLLQLEVDRWRGENILIHEFGHTWFELGIQELSDGAIWQGRLNGLYSEALAMSLWSDTYAATHVREYWAEGVQSWFDSNQERIPTNGIHNHVDTREELTTYDPGLAELLEELFGARRWEPWCDATDHPDAAPWSEPTPPEPPQGGCSFAIPVISSLGCDAEQGLALVDGGDLGVVQFVNQSTSGDRVVFSLSYTGARVERARLAPRSSRSVSTSTGEPWVVATEAGECLVVVQPEGGQARVLLP